MQGLKILSTGQKECYNASGDRIDCRGSGQDGEYQKGLPWPSPRFSRKDDIVDDYLTGLCWPANANLAEFPITWHETFDFIRSMNERSAFGFNDWRLPDRTELRSLISYATKRPALPQGHPFENVFLGWYWTSTTAAINNAYAWYIHMDGARMFYGEKNQYYLVWPVRGASTIFRPIDLPPKEKSRQTLPAPRFVPDGEEVLDRFTGLIWLRKADCTGTKVSWQEALQAVDGMKAGKEGKKKDWRLPNINELESLVDCSEHSPALPADHPFQGLRDVYWSSTTSVFEPDWSWALYLAKGALGVGFKAQPDFYVWPVRDG